ncbi:MAG: phosphatidylserine decarboxylase [Solirubrobacteraceae bacterium]|jgi:phosphatidylserine decarboxylase|nr:phosphatidylserine decarboxylase [Solirubrobacteraceae bacterium]
MGDRARSVIDASYQNSFAVRAGYLPMDRGELDEWHLQLGDVIAAHDVTLGYSAAVEKVRDLIYDDPIVRMWVTQMLEQALELERTHDAQQFHITKISDLLAALDWIVTQAPTYGGAGGVPKIHFPMSALFGYMMMTDAGEALFRHEDFNAALLGLLKQWCTHLESPKSASVLNGDPGGWLSPKAIHKLKLREFERDEGLKHWGYLTWNSFFHRELEDVQTQRPLAGEGDHEIVVSANDGQVRAIGRNVHGHDEFWAKGNYFSLRDILRGHYIKQFSGGDVLQSFLEGSDYHHFVSPIEGTITKIVRVPGLLFSDAESAGFDPSGVNSLVYDTAVNTRTLVFIEGHPDIGMVCVIPIGITEISSIVLADKIAEKSTVKKGQKLGWFRFGGSTLCIVFQPGKVELTVDEGSPLAAREQIAVVTKA